MNTIKRICTEICFFDVECVPDIAAGRRMFKADAQTIVTKDERVITHDEATDAEIAQAMLDYYSDSRGFFKSVLYRIVSIAAVIRKVTPDGIALKLFSLPNGDDDFTEAKMIERFLNYIGNNQPQVVGFASQSFDLTVLWQRAIVNGINVKPFTARPAKPWDDAPDYFARDGNDYNVDLLKIVGTASETIPRLAHIAAACRIPGKLGVDGSMVSSLWNEGKRREIVDYNECDALTTYLLWIHCVAAHGLLTAEQIESEKTLLNTLLSAGREEKAHLALFQDAWHELNQPDEPKEIDNGPTRADLIKAIADGAAAEKIETKIDPVAKSLGDMITAKQLGMIRALCREAGLVADVVCAEKFACKVDELSKRAASDLIEHLQAKSGDDNFPTHSGPAQEPPPGGVKDHSEPATAKQKAKIKAVAKEKKIDPDKYALDAFKTPISKMTKPMASSMIEALENCVGDGAVVPPLFAEPPKHTKPITDDSTFVCTSDDCKSKGEEFPLHFTKREGESILCMDCSSSMTRTDDDIAF